MHSILVFLFFLACGDSTEPTRGQIAARTAEVQAFEEKAKQSVRLGISEPTSRVKGSLLERHAQIGSNPEDAIALWVEAAVRAQAGESEGWEALGELTLTLKDEPNWRRSPRNNYFVKQLDKNAPCFRSLVVGTEPETAYEVDLENIRIELDREDPTSDIRGRKFFVRSSGAEMPRPVYMKQSNKTDLFYINEYSSLYVDVRPPVDPDQETFR
jgi:hypothetical protein